jgi:hypothetical protein
MITLRFRGGSIDGVGPGDASAPDAPTAPLRVELVSDDIAA